MTIPAIKVACSRDFFKALNRLPEKGKSKVAKFITSFMDQPTGSGLNYEKISGGLDPQIRSVRVDQDFRCIVRAPEKGNTYVLLWVDKHDDAYAWARNKSCHVNRVSGALQIVDVVAAEQAVEASPTDAIESAPAPPVPLFHAYSDEQLMQLGVPEALLPSLRAVLHEDSLARLIEWLPQDSVDGLIALTTGQPFEQVVEELGRNRPAQVDPSDLDTALAQPESQAEFVVITGDEALEAILSAPLEQWRVFLHPSQRRLVERQWNGPVRVLGGAGTGKTVVAMHRARWLAQQCLADGRGRVLFTTFTRNLATDIRSNLNKICTPQELQKIEVVSLDAWVMNFLKTQGLQVRVFSHEARKAAWDVALAMEDAGFDERFYEEEWKEVVLPNGCRTLDDYLAARRIGRGTRLSKAQRAQVWPVFDALRAEFRLRGLWEPEEAKQMAAELITSSAQEPRYSAVVVDEAQDLDVPSFQLIRALVGEEHPNDLFIVGDAHQRIYGRPITLSRCGINVRGRSRKLRINYRTTEETRAWATAVLVGQTFDDLDGGLDGTSDYRSLLHGERPVVKEFEDPAREQEYLEELVTHLREADGSLASTCVTSRTRQGVDKLASAFEKAGVATRVIEADEADDPSDPALRLATMHRVKGLEFDQVLIPCLSDDQMPLRSELARRPDQVSRDLFEQQERSLLHVAATRAKKRVVVTYSGKPSSFLTTGG